MPPRDWPQPYLPDDAIAGNPPDPIWSKQDVVNAGAALAERMLTDPIFAEAYGGIVRDTGERHDRYHVLINALYPNNLGFNSNDFANIHHVAWILLLRTVVSITNENIHGDWGEPPAESSFHADSDRDPNPEWFHNTPNATGYFAVSTLDVQPANAGV